MKRQVRLRLSLAIFVLAGLSVDAKSGTPSNDPAPQNPRKLALLIGIDKYQAVSGLHGCVNDVERMRALLVGKFGFLEKDVLVLKNAQATNAGIRQAFKRHLIDQAHQNVVVVFHFSGHGSRMKDVSGDEIDGWDETIVPVDSRQPGIFDIPDDDLGELLSKVSRKTPYVTFILDSCHSGSATRGGVLARRIPDDPRNPPAPVGGVERARGGQPVHFVPSDTSYVLIAGCGPKELSNEYESEGQSYGALTYFLTSSLSRAGSATTYRDLMDRVRCDVAAVYPSQHPQLEGLRADTEVFGVTDGLAEPHFLVTSLGGLRVEVAGGRAHGLTVGSSLEVYPPGTKKFEPGSGTARVELTQTDAFRSEAKIVKGGAVAAQSRAVLRQRRYPDENFRIFLGKLSKPTVMAEIRERIKDYPEIEVVTEESAARMSVSEKDGALQCLSGDLANTSPPVSLSDPEISKRIGEQVAHWAKWYTIFSLSNSSPSLGVRLELPSPAGGGSFSDGDTLDVSVTNLSKGDVYVSIVDLSGDGSAEPLYPKAGVEESLPANQTFTQQVRVFVPAGRDSVTDVIKVIAATEYINPAVFRLGSVRGARLGPLARLAQSSTSRGGSAVDAQGWTTVQKALTIKRRPEPQATPTSDGRTPRP